MSDTPAPSRLTAKPLDAYTEGDTFRGVTIEYMLWDDKDLLIFIDSDGFVWYEWSETFTPPAGFEEVRNRIGVLEAIDTSYLKQRQVLSFKRMLGDALICILNEKNQKAALDNLDKAQAFIAARNQEAARWWYVTSSSLAAIIVGLFALFSWSIHSWIVNLLHPGFMDFLYASCAGGIGAWLSILLRVGSVPLDSSAGRWMYYLEGVSRIAVGFLGAIVITLAYKLGLVFSIINQVPDSRLEGVCFVGFFAGISERLLPNFIRRVELADDKNEPKLNAGK